jgi:branched-chain amino acid transport system ATP-binding protein
MNVERDVNGSPLSVSTDNLAVDHESLLDVRNIEVTYKGTILALKGLSLSVNRDSIVTLLGANGAGKTTALRAIFGLLPVHQGRITAGAILFEGQSIVGQSASDAVRRGVGLVMEGRRIFAELTVDENLQVGAFTRHDRTAVRRNYERVLDLFPILSERRNQIAGYLSGGQQQMLAIGRALMAGPRLLLLDEPSLGLAPRVIREIRDHIVRINREGVSVLLIEQNAAVALSMANHGYVVENGRTVLSGTQGELVASPLVREHYLGIGRSERSSQPDSPSIVSMAQAGR